MNTEIQQRVLTPCPQCGKARIGVRCNGDMDLRAAGKFVSDLAAVVCIACGYTTLYALDLQRLWKELDLHPEHFVLPLNFRG